MNRDPFRDAPRFSTAWLAASAIACIASTLNLAANAAPQRATSQADARTEFATAGDTLPTPLAAGGNASRGRALIVARGDANCVLCHSITDQAIRVSGNVGPSLDGVGRRLTVGQLRLRVADMQRVSSASTMPSYYRTDGLDRVAEAYRQRPILDAIQVEDIVAYLASLR